MAKKPLAKKKRAPRPAKVTVTQAAGAVMTLARFVAPGPMKALDAAEKLAIRTGVTILLKKLKG